jgi:hypothetical protein
MQIRTKLFATVAALTLAGPGAASRPWSGIARVTRDGCGKSGTANFLTICEERTMT